MCVAFFLLFISFCQTKLCLLDGKLSLECRTQAQTMPELAWARGRLIMIVPPQGILTSRHETKNYEMAWKAWKECIPPKQGYLLAPTSPPRCPAAVGTQKLEGTTSCELVSERSMASCFFWALSVLPTTTASPPTTRFTRLSPCPHMHRSHRPSAISPPAAKTSKPSSSASDLLALPTRCGAPTSLHPHGEQGPAP